MAYRTPADALHPIEAAERQRRLLLRFVRFAFVILFLAVTITAILTVGPNSAQRESLTEGLALRWPSTIGLAIVIAAVVILVDVFTPRKKVGILFSIFVGLLTALLATACFALIIDLLAIIYDFREAVKLIAAVKGLIGIAITYLAISTVLQTQDDFRLVVPYVEFTKQLRGARPMLLDSSALIDGRIHDVGQTGLIQAPLVIPAFVVAELQLLADSSDRLRRAKGRRGLDLVGRLQRSANLDVTIDETPVPGKAVDQMLLELGRSMSAIIVTADVALARMASIQGVRTLNLNDVANALKPALLPGEAISLRLLKPGEQPGQAVGYLDDGTMVVAEDGAEAIGREVELVVSSSLQTSAGRLLFARLGEGERSDQPPSGATRPAEHADARPRPAAPQLPESQSSPGVSNPTSPSAESADEATGAGLTTRPGPYPPKRGKPDFRRNPRRG